MATALTENISQRRATRPEALQLFSRFFEQTQFCIPDDTWKNTGLYGRTAYYKAEVSAEFAFAGTPEMSEAELNLVIKQIANKALEAIFENLSKCTGLISLNNVVHVNSYSTPEGWRNDPMFYPNFTGPYEYVLCFDEPCSSHQEVIGSLLYKAHRIANAAGTDINEQVSLALKNLEDKTMSLLGDIEEGIKTNAPVTNKYSKNFTKSFMRNGKARKAALEYIHHWGIMLAEMRAVSDQYLYLSHSSAGSNFGLLFDKCTAQINLFIKRFATEASKLAEKLEHDGTAEIVDYRKQLSAYAAILSSHSPIKPWELKLESS